MGHSKVILAASYVVQLKRTPSISLQCVRLLHPVEPLSSACSAPDSVKPNIATVQQEFDPRD